MYLYSQSIPDSTIIAGGATVLFLYGLSLPDTYNSDVLCGPAFVYIVIWLGIHLPFHRIGKRNDLSFGVYIYGFAVQQLLAVWGVYRWGYVPCMGLAVLLSLFLAAVSWRLVESQAMRLKHWTPSLRHSSPDGLLPRALKCVRARLGTIPDGARIPLLVSGRGQTIGVSPRTGPRP